MQTIPTPTIEHLLLSAPKERRLDLAIATLLYEVSQEYALVVVDGKQAIEPIWYFARDRDLPPYAYACKPIALFSHCVPYMLGQVPFYTQEKRSYEEVVSWFTKQNLGKFQIIHDRNGESESLKVNIVHFLQGNIQLEHSRQERLGVLYDWQREIYRLTCLVVLDTCAPALVPLLRSNHVPQLLQPKSFLDYPKVARAQKVLLLPLQVPTHPSISSCMYREYHAQTETWKSCTLLEQARYAPEPCPVCGGYYCEKHFSHVSYWFESVASERRNESDQRSLRQRLSVCIHCASLPEQDAQQIRTTRLALNAR